MRFQSIHEIPKHLRKISGTPLSLSQIEALLDEAEASGQAFGAALATAKRDFIATHTADAGHWVAN
jgi:hypothetical protein